MSTKPPKPPEKTNPQQISEIMQELRTIRPAMATEERFGDICMKVSIIPIKHRPAELLREVAQTFGKTGAQLSKVLKTSPRPGTAEFDSLVPNEGWIHDYIEWTRGTEPPTVFHFIIAATMIGATLGRRVYFDKGAYRVYPAICVMLVAPPGRCRKTSAANLGTGLYSKAGGTCLAEKPTPEALVDSLKLDANALLYAPELAFFLGKQKYSEGMVPLLLRLLECPDELTVKTIGRGETTLTNVAVSALVCTTIESLQTSVPADAFGGGFMSRFLYVVQENTDRCFPRPDPLDKDIKKNLIVRLGRMRNIKAPVPMTPGAMQWYDDWYRARSTSIAPEKQFAGYWERKPDHILRVAMSMVVSYERPVLEMTETDLKQAGRILGWLEEWLPSTFDQLTTNSTGEDQVRILRILRQAGGSMEHSALLRRNSGRMNGEQFRRCITTLHEAKLIERNDKTKTYYLTSEGWG